MSSRTGKRRKQSWDKMVNGIRRFRGRKITKGVQTLKDCSPRLLCLLDYFVMIKRQLLAAGKGNSGPYSYTFSHIQKTGTYLLRPESFSLPISLAAQGFALLESN